MISNPIEPKNKDFSILLFICDALCKTKTPNKFGEFLWKISKINYATFINTFVASY